MPTAKSSSIIKSNLSLEKIFQFREIGYIEEVINKVIDFIDFSEMEIWLVFRLANSRREFTLPKSNKKQVVFIVADESDFLPHNILTSAFAIFKQYLPDNTNFSNVFHLPVGPSRLFNYESIRSIHSRKYNVFFSGNLHLGRRELYNNFTSLNFLPFPALHRIQNMRKATYDRHFPNSYIRFSKGFHNGLNSNEYANILYEAKIVLCPYGLRNRETMRHFEAMRAGALVITKPMPDHECYMGAPLITVNKWSDLDCQIDILLRNQNLLEEYHKRTISWWHQKCSPEGVAKYVIDKLNSLAS